MLRKSSPLQELLGAKTHTGYRQKCRPNRKTVAGCRRDGMFSLDNVLQRKSDVANVSQPALRVFRETALQQLSEWTRDRFPIRLAREYGGNRVRHRLSNERG